MTLEQRTLGELAAMRDALSVAREDVLSAGVAHHTERTALLLAIGVLEAIVNGTPYAMPAYVRDRITYKSPSTRKK